MKIEVLDHGFARLVSYMQPVIHDPAVDGRIPDEGAWTGDLEIVRNARVSYDADWRGATASVHPEQNNKDEKLIRYLMANRHTSPFEAMVFTFEIKCPFFIARQWHRHRTWSYNEVSARYTELPEEFYVPDPDKVGVQSKSNKQARTLDVRADVSLGTFTGDKIDAVGRIAFESYRLMLEAGVPRELARSVLPMATYTRFFGTVNLHNLFHFIRLRDHEHAQYEIRVYAQALKELVRPICPIAVAAFDETLESRT